MTIRPLRTLSVTIRRRGTLRTSQSRQVKTTERVDVDGLQNPENVHIRCGSDVHAGKQRVDECTAAIFVDDAAAHCFYLRRLRRRDDNEAYVLYVRLESRDIERHELRGIMSKSGSVFQSQIQNVIKFSFHLQVQQVHCPHCHISDEKQSTRFYCTMEKTYAPLNRVATKRRRCVRTPCTASSRTWRVYATKLSSAASQLAQ